MRRRKEERNYKFRNVQENILSPTAKSYYATHYIGSTIRSGSYNEGRVSRDIQPAGFSSNDSIGLESMFPRIASDFFKVQIPKPPPPLPIQVHQIDRREYNMAHDTVRPSQTSGLQIAREPEYVEEIPARFEPDAPEYIDEVAPPIVPDDVEYVEEIPAQIVPDVPEFIEPVAEKPLTKKQKKAFAQMQTAQLAEIKAQSVPVKAKTPPEDLAAQREEEARQKEEEAKEFEKNEAKKEKRNRKAREKRAREKAEKEAAAAQAEKEQPAQKVTKIKKAKA